VTGHGVRPTMRDVARHARVALKTVSRVVNGEPGVREETAERVRSAITALGYRRNDSARVLRRGQTALIGLLMEDIGDPFYATLSRAVEDVAARHDTLLITGSSDEDPARERTLALAFSARRVDGLIVIPASADHSYLRPEMAAGCALVFVDRPPRLLEADTVLTDNRGGACSGVAHLIAGGHRRIGFIGDDPRIYTAAQRYLGYHDAMTAAGLRAEAPWITMESPSQAGVRDTLRRMLAGPAPVTAVFCGNNRVTALTLRELKGLADPSVALVGFDDLELADLLEPAVTVVAQSTAELGRIAAELLFRRLGGYSGPPERVELGTTLVVRGSGELPPRPRLERGTYCLGVRFAVGADLLNHRRPGTCLARQSGQRCFDPGRAHPLRRGLPGDISIHVCQHLAALAVHPEKPRSTHPPALLEVTIWPLGPPTYTIEKNPPSKICAQIKCLPGQVAVAAAYGRPRERFPFATSHWPYRAGRRGPFGPDSGRCHLGRRQYDRCRSDLHRRRRFEGELL
jgi:LacI family transcriptional regulator